MLLMIDNYDSFTYNLVQYFQELNQIVKVVRNDEITLTDVEKLNPQGIVISPGPGTPAQAGISREIIQTFFKDIPILGICLGHQCLGEVFGAKVVHAKQVMHGKSSVVFHTKSGLFAGIKNPLNVVRYHSLVLAENTISDVLKITAWTEDSLSNKREIMAVEHKEFPLFGVQFHPESILTECGHMLLRNFLVYLHEK